MSTQQKSSQQSGFTLIELLIVIVIIGILAGVLVQVINPSQQSNRARDAGVKASMNKVSLATEGFVSAYGKAPSGAEFIGALQNVSPSGTVGGGCGVSDEHCLFAVTGNPLSAGGSEGCGSTNYSGVGGGQCYYRYERVGGPTGTVFNVYGKSYGIANTVFKYTNTAGQILDCPADSVNQGSPGC